MKRIVPVLMMTLLLIGVLTLTSNIQPVNASETIYIRADGSVDPSWAPIARNGSVYTFTGNVNDSIVIERSNIIVDGNGHTLQGPGIGIGIDLTGRSDVTIKNMEIKAFSYGIYLHQSSNNTISGNIMTTNVIGVNSQDESSHNIISGNNVANNERGILISGSLSSYNIVIRNNITANSPTYGILLAYSSNNLVVENNMINNYRGVWLYSSSNNAIYHNNLVNNTYQIDTTGSTNDWDDGYPSGGNFWSDYNGTDLYRGQYQDIVGSDGIGDTSYVIGSNNTDNYPLMGSVGSSTTTGENVTVFPTDDVCLTFESVTANGSTTVEKSGTGPDPPPGYTIDQYYNIETTAKYSGTIRIRIIYDDSSMTEEEEADLQLIQHVTIPGDLDGDYDVDLFDAVKLLVRYGVKEGEPDYEPDCDIDKDGRIFLYDAVILCSHYGQELEPSERWQDVTVQIDTENNLIFAETTHLSIFGVTRG